MKHLQFSKVFWDYTSAEDDILEESPSPAGELQSTSSRNSDRKSERAKATHFLSPSSKYRPQGKQQACVTVAEWIGWLSGTSNQKFSSKELKPAGKARKGPTTRDGLLRASSAHKTQRSDADSSRIPGGAAQDTRWARPSRTDTCGPDRQRTASPQRVQSRRSEATKRVAGFPSSTADQQGRPSRGHPGGSVRGGSSLQARTRS